MRAKFDPDNCLTCLRCGYQWTPRRDSDWSPSKCFGCKSTSWDKLPHTKRKAPSKLPALDRPRGQAGVGHLVGKGKWFR